MDKEVAHATEIRKQEHQTYLDLVASDSAAKELIAFAKNRLNKFYQPSMYNAPDTEVEGATSFVNLRGLPSFAQVSSHQQAKYRLDEPHIDDRF